MVVIADNCPNIQVNVVDVEANIGLTNGIVLIWMNYQFMNPFVKNN